MSETGHNPMRWLVVFGIAGQRYALDLPVVERVLRMVQVSPLPKAPPIVLGVINFHGQIIPAIDLVRRLGHSPDHYGLSSFLMVAKTSRRRLAFPVGQVHGVQEVPIESITLPEAGLLGTGLVAGVLALPDGVLFIHDLDTVLSLNEEQGLTQALDGDTE